MSFYTQLPPERLLGHLAHAIERATAAKNLGKPQTAWERLSEPEAHIAAIEGFTAAASEYAEQMRAYAQGQEQQRQEHLSREYYTFFGPQPKPREYRDKNGDLVREEQPAEHYKVMALDLPAFCAAHGLDPDAMHWVAMGELPQHKQWRQGEWFGPDAYGYHRFNPYKPPQNADILEEILIENAKESQPRQHLTHPTEKRYWGPIPHIEWGAKKQSDADASLQPGIVQPVHASRAAPEGEGENAPGYVQGKHGIA